MTAFDYYAGVAIFIAAVFLSGLCCGWAVPTPPTLLRWIEDYLES